MLRMIGIVLVALALNACTGLPGSDPTRFYVMKTADDLKAEAGSGTVDPALNVGVGPVEIPGYADRAQIVTFGSGARITVADFDHWAEPVGDAIQRILSANLATIIGETKVFPYPADFRPEEQSVQIALEVVNIYQDDTGLTKLSVRWHMKRLYENRVVLRNAKTYSAQSVAGDYNSYADALTGLLGELAKDLAASLASIESSA